jgi:chromosome partitioning protein
VLTECFLREAHFYMSPAKPDYISARGLKFLREFRQRDPQMGFAENLGVIINMKDLHSAQDEHFDGWLRQDPEYRCFDQSLPRVTALQATGYISAHPRSYWAKYPGETGDQLRQLETAEQGRLRADGKLRAAWSAWKERRV